MFINFNGFEDLNETCLIQVKLGNAIIQKQSLPLIFAQQNFMQLVMELSRDQRPMCCVCTRQVFTEENRQIPNSLEFRNNSYVKEFDKEEQL